MRKFSLLTAAIVVASLGTTVGAQGQGSGKGPTMRAQGAAQGPKAGGGSSNKSSGATLKSANGASKSGGAGGSRKSGTTTSTDSTSTDSTSTTTASVETTTFEPNDISIKISKNPNQLARVEGMLPAGMSIEEASAGFRNQGQFIAALNVSNNQGLDFVQLKDAMLLDGLSLGQAAKQVRTAPAPEAAVAPAGTGESTGGSTDGGSTGGSTEGGSTGGSTEGGSTGGSTSGGTGDSTTK